MDTEQPPAELGQSDPKQRRRRADSLSKAPPGAGATKAEYEKFMLTVYQAINKKKCFEKPYQTENPAKSQYHYHNTNPSKQYGNIKGINLNMNGLNNHLSNKQYTQSLLTTQANNNNTEAGECFPRLTLNPSSVKDDSNPQQTTTSMLSSSINVKLDLEAQLQNAILTSTRGFPNPKYKALKNFLNSYQEMKKKSQRQSMKMLGLEVRKLDYAHTKNSQQTVIPNQGCARHSKTRSRNCRDCNDALRMTGSCLKSNNCNLQTQLPKPQSQQNLSEAAITLNARGSTIKNRNNSIIECRGYSTRKAIAAATKQLALLQENPVTLEQELLLSRQENGGQGESTLMGSTCSANLKSNTSTVNTHSSSKYVYFHEKVANKKFKFSLSENTNSIYENKMTIYRDFLFKLYFAHNVYVELLKKDEEPNFVLRNEQKYRVWIGPGNNNLLVKSLIKRRFWWMIVDDRNDCSIQFYWTQLKINDLYKKQPVSKTQKAVVELLRDKKKNREELIGEEDLDEEDTQEEKIKTSRRTRVVKKDSVVVTANRTGSISSPQGSPQKRRPLSTTKKAPESKPSVLSKIFSPEDEKLTRTYTQIYELKHPQPIAHKKMYLRKKLVQDNVEANFSTIVHNHLENNFFLGNKKAMFYNLKQYYELKGGNVFEFLPLTFHIRNGMKCPQYKRFLHYHKKRAAIIKHQQKQEDNGERVRQKMRNIWIVKPGELSNRGNGITVIDQVYELNKILNKKETHANGSTKTYIVQLYIDRPLLYNRRKFDIRHYMLITNLYGVIRGYWYAEGYIRTASYQFDIDTFDREIHLTNDAIQKYTDSYGRYEPANKLSYSEFQRYLDTTYPLKHYNFAQQILPKMRQVATDAVRSAYLKISPNNLEHNFQIFGLDFMIDENFRPWLIEINTNPCLELACPLLERIIPLMVEQSLRLSLDVIFPPPCHYSNTNKHLVPDASLENLKYTLIFDSLVDGESVSKLYKDVKTNKLMDEIGELSDDEEYADEGREIKGDENL